jgi:hypothetical protein
MDPSFANLPRWKTERLSMRPLVMEDAPRVATLTDDPTITDAVDFLHSPLTIADAESLISRIDDENCFLGVWRGDELTGVVGRTHMAMEDWKSATG